MSAVNAIEKGLPTNVDAERFVLGSIMLDDSLYIQAAGDSARMRIAIANELMKFNELEACGNITYLVSLDDGLPQIPNLDAYIRIVKDKAVLRRIIFASQHMMNRALLGEEEPDEILSGAEEALLKLGEARVK